MKSTSIPPAVIIETGFLNLDRQILTNYPENRRTRY